jgi:chromate transporter
MKKDLKFYLKLFTSTFYLSAFTFGGGFVIIPLMRKKFVEQYHWIEEKEMLDLTAIAQSSPGAIAVNAAILIGYRLAGVLGSMITILGTVLPPFITLSIISLAYTAFKDSLIINYVLRGMQAGVAAVIIDVVISMAMDLFKEKKVIPIIVMIGVFIAAYFFHISIMILILISGIIGVAAMFLIPDKSEGGELK